MILPVLALYASFASNTPIRLEAESGRLFGLSIASQRSGFSGSGYVTGFHGSDAHVEIPFSAPGGLYEVRLRYSSPLGPKGYDIAVNGSHSSGMFTPTKEVWEWADCGKAMLRPGANTFDVYNGWGWFDIDCVELIPTSGGAVPLKPAQAPADPDATPEARALLRRLVSLYGTHTLSGQFDIGESDYVRATTGMRPAILGSDFMDYSPSRIEHGAKPEGGTERVIAAAKQGQIISMCWHWNAPKDLIDKNYTDASGKMVEAPWYKGFYTYATTFNVEKTLADPTSEDYKLILRDIDAIAVQLKKFSDARVPVLWRPLHEAEGGWFWWGAKGPAAYIKLYKLMFDRLTKVHQLHNLLWVENSLDPKWYPGDAYTDIVAVDAYPSDWRDPLSSTWDSLQKRFNGRKLLAIAELGGAADVDKMFAYGARWLYFVSWTDGAGPHKLTRAELNSVYRSPLVVDAPR